MFNGIIKNTGVINKIYHKNKDCLLEIKSKMKFSKEEIGSSIACSGVCLTLDNFKSNNFKNLSVLKSIVSKLRRFKIWIMMGIVISGRSQRKNGVKKLK